MIQNKILQKNYAQLPCFLPSVDIDFTDKMIAYDYNEVLETFYNKNNYYVLLVGNTNLHKKSMMGCLIQNLMAMGIDKNDILYIDFCFPLFLNMNIEEFLEYFIEGNDRQLYLFINEFHFIKNWHSFLMTLHRKFPQVKFVGTSSVSPDIYIKLNDDKLDYCKIIVLSEKNNSNTKSISQGFGIYHQIKYNIKDNQIEIKGLTKEGKLLSTIEIPESIEGISVTIIASGAFHDRENLSKVVLPATIKMIGDYAFARCTYLEKISLPESLEYIGENAFIGCSELSVIETGQKIKHIGNSAFYGTKWLKNQSEDFIILGNVLYSYIGKNENIFVPNEVASICNYAFANNENIQSIQISNTECIIGEGVFYGCTNLTSIFFKGEQADIKAFSFYNCFRLKTVDFYGVSSIGDFAFANCKELKFLSVNENVSIGNGAFYNCLMFKKFLGDYQIKTIGNSAFYNCKELIDGSFLKKTEYIGNFSFALSGIVEVHLDSIEKMASFVFYDCINIVKVTMDRNIEIGNHVFDGAINIESMQISGNNAISHFFGGINKIPSKLTTIIVTGEKIIDNFCRGCHTITKIVISSKLKEMGRWTFYGCENLNEIIIENGLTRIGDWAFSYCNRLNKMILPQSILEIGMNAFRYCNNLREIVIKGTEEIVKFEVNAFYSTSENKKIIVPQKIITYYQSNMLWQEYRHLIRAEKDEN